MNSTQANGTQPNGAQTDGAQANGAQPGDTQQANADGLVEAFEMFDSWEERYGFLIDLGRKLPPLDEAGKTEENRVYGCQSNVWLVAQPRRAAAVNAASDAVNAASESASEDVRSERCEEVIDFVADSDSSLVRGLIAILRKVYSGQPAARILAFDIKGLFERLGLNQHLSTGRRNGLYGMVQRIRALAARQIERTEKEPSCQSRMSSG